MSFWNVDSSEACVPCNPVHAAGWCVMSQLPPHKSHTQSNPGAGRDEYLDQSDVLVGACAMNVMVIISCPHDNIMIPYYDTAAWPVSLVCDFDVRGCSSCAAQQMSKSVMHCQAKSWASSRSGILYSDCSSPTNSEKRFLPQLSSLYLQLLLTASICSAASQRVTR